MRTRLACTLTASFIVLGAASTLVAQDADTLYTCTAEDDTRTLDIGVTLCDATPTDGLTQRLEVDNLQLRSGALVTEVTLGGSAKQPGWHPETSSIESVASMSRTTSWPRRASASSSQLPTRS